MVPGILVTGLFWWWGIVALRWGLRLRRGEGRLPSGRWGRANAVSLIYGDPDRNMLAAGIFGLGLATFMTALGIVLATSSEVLAIVATAVGGSAFVGTGLLWLSLAVFNRPQGLLPPHLRKTRRR